MVRDFSKFPDDENGNTLWNMALQGDDLSERRDVEFTVAFRTEDEALKFGEILLFNRQQVLLCDNEESDDYPYDIIVTVAMVPSHKEITDFEDLLHKYAKDLDGINDGWGCYVQGETP